MAMELTSIQEVVDSMCMLAVDPCLLPAASQQVIDDHTQTQDKWFCQVCSSDQLFSTKIDLMVQLVNMHCAVMSFELCACFSNKNEMGSQNMILVVVNKNTKHKVV